MKGKIMRLNICDKHKERQKSKDHEWRCYNYVGDEAILIKKKIRERH